MNENYIEIELRYMVHDVGACLAHLEDLGMKVLHVEHLIDEWYLPSSIKSLEEEKLWFDEQKGIAWRVRRTMHGTKDKLEVTSKQITDAKNHNTFSETTSEFKDYETAVQAMDKKDYRNWLTIDKTRYFLTSINPLINNAEFELVIDKIAGLEEKIGIGACLEIEHKGASNRERALRRVEEVAKILGFNGDDQFEKSLTVTSMTELARF